jgi:beta-glucan synthesis-associated protein KRE6
LGTFPNQTAPDGTPEAAATGSRANGPLSFLPGQRLSACTCPGSDHPGPSTSDGRGVPEIDILEAQINTTTRQGEVSQSFQCAPYNIKYQFDEASAQITDQSVTHFNGYRGSEWQQAVSAVSVTDDNAYDGQSYSLYGYEWWFDQDNRADGHITWYSSGKESWRMSPDAVGPDPVAQIGPRLIPEEPLVSAQCYFHE